MPSTPPPYTPPPLALPPYPPPRKAVTMSYEESEKLLCDYLTELVKETAWLRSYVAAASLVFKEALQASMVALGPCRQPLPGCFPPVGEDGEELAVAGNLALAAGVPEVLWHGRHPLTRCHCCGMAVTH